MERVHAIGVDAAACVRCGRCVGVCPSAIFVQERPGGAVSLHGAERCIACGHCAAACPTGAVSHEAFPTERLRPLDRAALPSPEALEQLLAARRSMRCFTRQEVPDELLRRIVAAADRAPTASNARALAYVVVTDRAVLRRVVEFTLGVFARLVRLLSAAPVRWLVRPLAPGIYRYVSVFERMRREWETEGTDRILRGATALLAIHAPTGSRFGAEDANLACQNASLMAEALGVGQVYAGFVLTAARQHPGRLERLLGLAPDRRVLALLALGMPAFRYPRSFDRTPAVVRRI